MYKRQGVANGQTLENMGLTISGSYSENGKISFDETKFKEALERNPEQVQRLFTGTVDGKAVSYTHLDVYKRQVQRVPLFLLASCSIWVAKQPCLHYLFSLRPWFHTSNTYINVASAPSASSRVFSEHEC